MLVKSNSGPFSVTQTHYVRTVVFVGGQIRMDYSMMWFHAQHVTEVSDVICR
jgi:hypothetical protein